MSNEPVHHSQLHKETRQRLAEVHSLQRVTVALLHKLTLDQVLDAKGSP